jgi:DNA gyrase subunit A
VIEAFSRPRSSGINAISINEGDQLIEVRLTNGKNEIILANRNGRAIRFSENDVRDMGRGATGVGGMRLDEDPEDQVVGMVTVDPEDPTTTIFVASEKGNGKRSSLEDYRVTKRKGKGVKTLQVTEKTGKIVAIKVVHEDDDMLISTSSGIMIRMAAGSIRVSGRATQGVKVIRLDDQDSIADIAVVKNTGEEAEEAVIEPIMPEEMNSDILPDDFSAEEE